MDRDGWHLWAVFYARRVDPPTSPPVVIRAGSEDEREEKIAAYLKHGRKALDE
jgi:hypothetical protein